MILTNRRPDPPGTHAMTMVDNVIELLDNAIAAHPSSLNYVIADTQNAGVIAVLPLARLAVVDTTPASRPAPEPKKPPIRALHTCGISCLP